MTDNIVDDKTELNDKETQALEAKESKAGFSSGFNKVLNNESEETADKAASKKDDGAENQSGSDQDAATGAKVEDTTANAETDADKEKAALVDGEVEDKDAAAQQKFTDKLPDRIRGMEGRIGGLSTQLAEILETLKNAPDKPGENKPTEQELAAALKNPDAMAKLIETYDEFKPMQDEIEAIRTEMAEMGAEDTSLTKEEIQQQIKSAGEEGRELAKLDMKHPDWETTLGTKELKIWVLDGGPSAESYDEMNRIEAAAERETDPAKRQAGLARSNQMLADFKTIYPDWWADRGANTFSAKASDTIKLFDDYKAHLASAGTDGGAGESEDGESIDSGKGMLDAAAKKKEKADKRLAAVVNPTGSSGSSTTGKSPQQQFSSGFNKAMRKASGKM